MTNAVKMYQKNTNTRTTIAPRPDASTRATKGDYGGPAERSPPNHRKRTFAAECQISRMHLVDNRTGHIIPIIYESKRCTHGRIAHPAPKRAKHIPGLFYTVRPSVTIVIRIGLEWRVADVKDAWYHVQRPR